MLKRFAIVCAVVAACGPSSNSGDSDGAPDDPAADAASDPAIDAADDPAADAQPFVESRYWFAPNIGSLDMLELFTNPDGWTDARSKIDVLAFYSANIKAVVPENCAMCGPNLRPALIAADVFGVLETWGIDLAVESGVVKPGACTSADTVPGTQWMLGIVDDNGGEVDFITMDEPFRGGEMVFNDVTCGYTMAQSADQTAAWYETISAARPNLVIGEVEPYPYFSVAELQSWIMALEARGIDLPFFHLDVDLNALKNQTPVQTRGDLRALRDFIEDRGIRFGVIYIGNEWAMNQSNDQSRSYYETVMAWTEEIRDAIGAPRDVKIQSWVDSSGGGENGVERVLPVNLPEDGMYTHSRIINDVWSALNP